MYRKILVPLDGSGAAEVVLPYAGELAAGTGAEIALLHIVGPEERGAFAPLHHAYIKATVDTLRRQVRGTRKKVKAPPPAKTIQVTGAMVVGYPDDEIPRFADTNHIDLIIMSTQESSGDKHRRLGHIADKIVRQSRIPVWLVRAGVPDAKPYDKWPRKTLVVTLDGSELAESVLPHVEALARQSGGTVDVTFVRVCEPPPIPSYYSLDLSGVPVNWGTYVQQELERCRHDAGGYLDGIVKRFKGKKIEARGEILSGRASSEIIGYAAKNPYSVIVMTTHGRSGLGRLVYGSVTGNVIAGASNPILLVRTNK